MLTHVAAVLWRAGDDAGFRLHLVLAAAFVLLLIAWVIFG